MKKGHSTSMAPYVAPLADVEITLKLDGALVATRQPIYSAVPNVGKRLAWRMNVTIAGKSGRKYDRGQV
jgi:hypothetical protein